MLENDMLYCFMTFFNDAVIFYMTVNCGVMWFQLGIIVHRDIFPGLRGQNLVWG